MPFCFVSRCLHQALFISPMPTPGDLQTGDLSSFENLPYWGMAHSTMCSKDAGLTFWDSVPKESLHIMWSVHCAEAATEWQNIWSGSEIGNSQAISPASSFTVFRSYMPMDVAKSVLWTQLWSRVHCHGRPWPGQIFIATSPRSSRKRSSVFWSKSYKQNVFTISWPSLFIKPMSHNVPLSSKPVSSGSGQSMRDLAWRFTEPGLSDISWISSWWMMWRNMTVLQS